MKSEPTLFICPNCGMYIPLPNNEVFDSLLIKRHKALCINHEYPKINIFSYEISNKPYTITLKNRDPLYELFKESEYIIFGRRVVKTADILLPKNIGFWTEENDKYTFHFCGYTWFNSKKIDFIDKGDIEKLAINIFTGNCSCTLCSKNNCYNADFIHSREPGIDYKGELVCSLCYKHTLKKELPFKFNNITGNYDPWKNIRKREEEMISKILKDRKKNNNFGLFELTTE